MWLLDLNMPNQLTVLLKSLAIQAATAHSQGWNTLNNGALVEAAAPAGFSQCALEERHRNPQSTNPLIFLN